MTAHATAELEPWPLERTGAEWKVCHERLRTVANESLVRRRERVGRGTRLRGKLRQACPQITIGRTVGAGHMHQLEVPEQINAMLDRFLTLNAPTLH